MFFHSIDLPVATLLRNISTGMHTTLDAQTPSKIIYLIDGQPVRSSSVESNGRFDSGDMVNPFISSLKAKDFIE